MFPHLDQDALSLQIFQGIAESSPWPILVCDASGRICYGNAPVWRLLNHTPKRNEEACVQAYFDSANQDLILNSFEELICPAQEAVSSMTIDCHLPSAGTTSLPVRLTLRKLLQEEPAQIALFFDLKQNDLSLLQQQALMQSLLDHTGAVVYVKDCLGTYLYVNHLFEELFGLKNRKIVGLTDFDVFSHELAEKFRNNDQKIIESKTTHQYHEVAPHADGLHSYISIKFPIFDHEGHVMGVGGISTDISEQKHNRKEMEAAQTVQRLLYPRLAPHISGYDIAGAVQPAETVSGDYYDYIEVGPQRVVIAVGDVSGHGLGPALEMVETRSYLRAILRTEIRLDLVMECLNEFLCRDLRECAFVSLFLAEFDFLQNSFSYVAAGHPGELIRQDGTCEHLSSTGLILGIDDQASYSRSPVIPLNPGDLVVLSTDGISETLDSTGEVFGRSGIHDFVRAHAGSSCSELVHSLLETCKARTEPRPLADDMTVVCIRRAAQ